MSSSDLLLNNILICCLSKNTSETASKYFDTQTVSTENDVYHCLRTQSSILIMQIQEWLSGSFDIKDVYGCIGTDLLLHETKGINPYTILCSTCINMKYKNARNWTTKRPIKQCAYHAANAIDN